MKSTKVCSVEMVDPILKTVGKAYDELHSKIDSESNSEMQQKESFSVPPQGLDSKIELKLNELIRMKHLLMPLVKELDEVNASIKETVGDRLEILTSKYIIYRTAILKKEFNVKAKTEFRISIKKL